MGILTGTLNWEHYNLLISTMEKQDEVYCAIGKENVLTLRESIKGGEISEDTLKKIARKMHSHVHGVFVSKVRNRCELDDVFMYMLDEWRRVSLYDGSVDGYEELVKILEDSTIRLNDLVTKMNKYID